MVSYKKVSFHTELGEQTRIQVSNLSKFQNTACSSSRHETQAFRLLFLIFLTPFSGVGSFFLLMDPLDIW